MLVTRVIALTGSGQLHCKVLNITRQSKPINILVSNELEIMDVL
jgi:hypothetical protein